MNAAAVAALLLALATGCSGPAYDPGALIAARAPAGATDCGQVGGWDDVPVAPARACVVAALATATGFHVLIDQLVSDGRLATGLAGDGRPGGTVQLHYLAVEPAIGSTDETIDWTACATLLDRGDGCDSLHRDLCFRCLPQ